MAQRAFAWSSPAPLAITVSACHPTSRHWRAWWRDIDLAGAAIELEISRDAEAAIDAAIAKDLTFFRRFKALRIGHDPLGAMALAGGGSRHWTDEAPHFARRLAALARDGLQKLAAADGRVIHNAGGSEAQELAFVLAVGLSYMRALEAAGLPLEQARGLIFFRLAADADQFLTIAKFRALRKLWARIEAACGLSPVPAFITAETAWRMMAQRDPHVNILRATIAVFAAAVGGADAISVVPFTAALGLPDEFARRNARNIQLILRDESNLAKVADAAAGSGAVEDLTDQLCGAAWTLFREIETAGGCAAALESGMIQSKVAAVRVKRQAAIASGKDALTGVSIFPALNEMQVAVLERVRPTSIRANAAGLHLLSAIVADPPCRTIRSFARRLGRNPDDVRRPAQSLSRLSRHGG